MYSVSIIIPVYNVGKYLDQCLESCVKQTRKDIEIIVVNDGSIDNSEEIIQRYKANDQRIVYVKQKNNGLPYARKAGINISRGKYLFHLDGDDYIPHDAIEILYNKAINTSSDIVFGSYMQIDEKSGVKKMVKNYYVLGNNPDNIMSSVIMGYMSWSNCFRLILRQYYIDVNPEILRGNMAEDGVVSVQLFFNSPKVEHVNECVYYYMRREGSLTFSIDENRNKSNIESSVQSFMFIRKWLLERYKLERCVLQAYDDYGILNLKLISEKLFNIDVFEDIILKKGVLSKLWLNAMLRILKINKSVAMLIYTAYTKYLCILFVRIRLVIMGSKGF